MRWPTASATGVMMIPTRIVCLDEFGPLNLQPHPGRQWACRGGRGHTRRRRRRATFHRLHGIRHMFAAYDLRADRLYGHIKPRKRRGEFLQFLRYVLSLCPEHKRLAIILDDFSPHLTTKTDRHVGDYAEAHSIELVYVPFNASWLNRTEAQFTGLRYFALDGTDYATHKEQGRAIRRYISWRNRNPHDPHRHRSHAPPRPDRQRSVATSTRCDPRRCRSAPPLTIR
jgi:hypothetical protein